MRHFALAASAAALPLALQAAEGRWTLDHFPTQAVKKAYNITADQAWLDHVRLSSVRLAGGCSASFVSPPGLIQTNHPCAHPCIEQLPTAQTDFQKGEVAGLIFDGNIPSLGGDFSYDITDNRAFSVSTDALREALGKVYHADRMVKELSD